MIKKLHDRFYPIKPFLPALCFVCGHTWDNLTLKRIDNPFDMTIFGIYMILAGASVFCISARYTFSYSRFLPFLVQFFFGALSSSFVVYYFKSASSLPTLIFVLLCIGLLVGNELINKKYTNVTLITALYAIISFMYFNAAIPVWLRVMNAGTFLLAITASGCVFLLIRKFSRNPSVSFTLASTIYALFTAMYFLNVIPPVPLAKKHMGIYRHVTHHNDSFLCTQDKTPLPLLSMLFPATVAWKAGDTVFCFTSIYAPAELKKKIFHHWYYRGEKDRRFTEVGKIGYRLTGGRHKGYRGYTYKKTLLPGRWKVVLKTSDKKMLGIVQFNVVPADSTPRTLVTRIF